ncbi:MAG: NAD kinase [Flavobacteriales bacterium]|nr:NAD kinase [Flavobacteriales bacterium]
MKVALFGIKTSPEISELILNTVSELQERNIQAVIYKKFYESLSLENELELVDFFEDYKDLKDKKVDLFFTFGGDGTILSAIPVVQDLPITIVGINTGRLGFLTTISKEEFLLKIDDFLSGNYNLSSRNLLSVDGDFDIDFPTALNEIAFTRKETTSMITIESYINGEYLNRFWGDGLVVSTPTGSTGYNLSCGGPIVFPESDTIILAPIAPHNLNVRPLMLSNQVKLKFIVHTRASEFSLSLDSRLVSLPAETEVNVYLGSYKVQIATHKKNSYYETLRKKLLWGNDARN